MAMSGAGNYTYCIRCDKLERIEQALTSILELECCDRIPLPPLAVDLEELCSCPWVLNHELWVIGLFVGASSWTVVKTSPTHLLCRRAIDATRPRLSALATHIGCDAFYVGVYEHSGILMEVDAHGRIFISGSVDFDDSQEGNFFDEQIDSHNTRQFFLLEMPEDIQRIQTLLSNGEERKHEQWLEQFLEDYAQKNFPQMASGELEQWKTRFKEDPHKLFRAEGGRQLFATWASSVQNSFLSHSSGFQTFDAAIERIVGGPRSYWYLQQYLEGAPLVYRAYTQQQQLAADGARLLYFRPAEYYLTNEDDTLW